MAPFRLGIWTGPFLVGDIDWPVSVRGYEPALAFTLLPKNGTLTAQQQSYNDVYGWYRVRIEHLFGQLWHIWRGSPDELHQSVCVLLHFMQFCIRRQVHHPRYGPWDHVPRKMKERMRQMCLPCVVRSAPPSQLVVSARSIIVINVLMPTCVGNKLFY